MRVRKTPVENRTYRIGWETRLPFQERGADGRPTGLAVELVREAARRRGIRLEWSFEPRSSETSLREKTVDLWPLMVITPERRRFLHITEPYLEVSTCFLVRADSRYAQSRDLDQATLAHFDSPVWRRFLAAQFPGTVRLPQPGLPAMLEALCDRRADAVFMEEDLAIMTLLDGFPCPGAPSRPPLRLIPVPEIRPRMGVGATFEARAAADAIRAEISNVAIDAKLAGLLSRGGYTSLRQLKSLTELSEAERRGRWLTAIATVFAALLALTLWQARRIRSQGIRAREAERIVRETEHKLRLMADSLKEMVLMYDMNRRLIYANPAATEITGYSIAELETEGFICWVHPEDQSRMLGYWDGLFQGSQFRDEEYRLISRDGRVKWVSATWGPIRDETGRQVGVLGSKRDITEHLELQARFQQVQRLESIGRLAGGVAHDFNNLLTVINGYSDLLLGRLSEADPLRPRVEQIRKAGARAAALTQQLLAFSRKQIIQPQPLNLNAVVADSVSLLRRLVGENIEVVTMLDPSLGCVLADAVQIHQVLMNLVVNARDAMPGGGRLVIETANVEPDQGRATEPPEAAAGPCVLLSVSDTGCGMDDQTRQHIFEPFFTTKEQGKGSGLGLSTVYGIVRQSQGQIWVDSAPGRGSTFKILLPRIGAGPETAETAAPDRTASARGPANASASTTPGSW